MPLTDSLISHWSLEEASGTRVDDHGDNDLAPVTADPGRSAAKVGFGTLFTGSDDGTRLRIASNASLQAGDIDLTICGWCGAIADATSDNHGLVGKGSTSNAEYIIDRLTTNQCLRFEVFGAAGFGSSSNVTCGTALPSDGSLHFFVAWHDSVANTINIQMDNGTIASNPHSAGIFVGTDDFLISIGGNIFKAEWDGLVDQVGLWKRVLTSDERSFLYNSGNGRSYADVVTGLVAPGAKIIFKNRDYV